MRLVCYIGTVLINQLSNTVNKPELDWSYQISNIWWYQTWRYDV